MPIKQCATVGCVRYEKDDPVDPSIPGLKGTSSLERLDIPKSGFRLDGEITAIECRHAVPCPTVPDKRERHLGPEPDSAREQLPKPAEESKLAGIEGGIGLGDGPGVDAQTDRGACAAELFQRYIGKLGSLDRPN